MLASDKIAGAFLAVVEEAEKLRGTSLNEDQENMVKTIISIAKHQSDIRKAKEGACPAHSSTGNKC